MRKLDIVKFGQKKNKTKHKTTHTKKQTHQINQKTGSRFERLIKMGWNGNRKTILSEILKLLLYYHKSSNIYSHILNLGH